MSTALHAGRLVAGLFGTLKLMQMYGPDNDATKDALDNLRAAVEEAAQESEAVVVVRGSRVLINGRLMRASECGALALAFLASEFARRKVHSIRIASRVPVHELSTLTMRFLDLDASRPEPCQQLIAQLGAAGVEHIQVEARAEADDSPVLLEERRRAAMKTYLRGLRAFRDVLRLDGIEDRARIRRARRAVHGLVDRFLEDESAVLALAQIRGYDQKLFHHSLNVCLFALALGQKLGLTRRQLGDLGMAALFHDIGKTVPAEAGAPDRHPELGARLLLAEGTAHEGILKAAIVAYEHHAHLDGGGRPRIDHEPHLFSRVVAIADCYEQLTTTRNYEEPPLTSAAALDEMQSRAGSEFDALLLKAFAGVVGLFPVGSLVELESGDYAVVVDAPGRDAPAEKPCVRLVDPVEAPRGGGDVIDLATTPGHRIKRAVSPHEIFETLEKFVSAT
ncbi:MAG: HD domain-containing phosphohydrolase [Planctomycetota bacterium]